MIPSTSPQTENPFILWPPFFLPFCYHTIFSPCWKDFLLQICKNYHWLDRLFPLKKSRAGAKNVLYWNKS